MLDAKRRRRDGCDLTVGKIGELLLADFEDAFRAGHPEIAKAILDDAVNETRKEAVVDRVRGELAVLVAVQATAGCDPQCVGAIDEEPLNAVIDEPVFFRVRRDRAVLEPRDAAASHADPDRPIAVLLNRAYRV